MPTPCLGASGSRGVYKTRQRCSTCTVKQKANINNLHVSGSPCSVVVQAVRGNDTCKDRRVVGRLS